ncbi:MAG: integrase core domain-containing protein [Terriglobia bacterium]|jgi:transposase InsO family protein
MNNTTQQVDAVRSRQHAKERAARVRAQINSARRQLTPGQQMAEAFPEDAAPRYLLRDRDKIYGEDFCGWVKGMGIQEVMIAPYSPWQNPFAERLAGSIRRECLDHVIVLGEKHLRRILKSYFAYYRESRTHLALAKVAPLSRPIQPPESGDIFEIPQVGGLHRRYERRAARTIRFDVADRPARSSDGVNPQAPS